MRFQTKKMTAWNVNEVEVKIEEGDLPIFPSWFPHSVKSIVVI